MRGRRRATLPLVAAAFVVLVAGLWASGQTGDWRLGAGGIGFAVGLLFFANEAEGGR